ADGLALGLWLDDAAAFLVSWKPANATTPASTSTMRPPDTHCVIRRVLRCRSAWRAVRRSWRSLASLRWRSCLPATRTTLPLSPVVVLIEKLRACYRAPASAYAWCYRFDAATEPSCNCGSHRGVPAGNPLSSLVHVLIAGFPAGSFAANCYIVAPGQG